LVRDRWPRFAAECATTLREADEPVLALQVDGLRVFQDCGCGDDFCQSFATRPPPDGPYGPGHRNVDLRPPWPGMLVLDVVGELIVFVEVLYRPPLD
jgi:hypothetical protein